MNKFEMIKWLQNLKKDIGQSQHQDLWHYAEMLDEVTGAIEANEDCISREYLKSLGYINKGDFNSVETIREWIDNAPSVIPKAKGGRVDSL